MTEIQKLGTFFIFFFYKKNLKIQNSNFKIQNLKIQIQNSKIKMAQDDPREMLNNFCFHV